jgi:hypothetical protein
MANEDIWMQTSILDRFNPSDSKLLALLFDRVDDGMLLEIARADYGDDVEIHLAALQRIRAGENIPVPMLWHPGEVLALARWTEISTELEAGGERSHWLRLFACAVLIWITLKPEGYDGGVEDSYWWQLSDGEDSTIIQFVDSVLILGEEISLAALGFLAWRLQSQFHRAAVDEDFGNCHLYAVAMLLIWASLLDKGALPADLEDDELVSCLIATAHCYDLPHSLKRDIDYCQLADKWRDKIQNLLLAPTGSDYRRSNLQLQNFGRELSSLE